MRRLLTFEGIHPPEADVSRLYIKRRNGGGGLIELISTFNAGIVGLSEYMNTLRPELNPSAQCRVQRFFFTGDFKF